NLTSCAAQNFRASSIVLSSRAEREHSRAQSRGILVLMREYVFFVYILANCSRHPFYVGVTRCLLSRLVSHWGPVEWENAFTARYNLNRLVYFEQFRYVNNAIAREKQLKRWSRSKKIALIEKMNPKWDDLGRGYRLELERSARLFENQDPSTRPRAARP